MIPTAIWVLVFASSLAQQAAPVERGSLKGTVVNAFSGEALSKVEVVAEPVEGNDSPAGFTLTDAKGNFTLAGLEPGSYRLAARRNGYLDTYYGKRRALKTGTPLTLEAGKTLDGLEIKAVPFGVIAGTIRDTDGEPMANISVELFEWRYDEGRRRVSGYGESSTDDLGQYRLIGLTPGKYYVCAKPSSNRPAHSTDRTPRAEHKPEAPVATFYPGTADPAAATLIDVAGGARITGIDIVLLRRPLFQVKVLVETPAGLTGRARLTYSIPGFSDIGKYDRTKDEVVIRDVPSGTWTLTASAEEARKESPGVITFEFSKRSYEARIPVQVISADIDDLRIALSAGAEVDGHVEVQGEKAPSIEGSLILFDNDSPNPNSSTIEHDGSFRNRLSPGHYEVNLSAITYGKPLFVESLRSDGRDILREGLTVAGPGKVSVEIVLSQDGGQLEGVVLDADDKPSPGATVVMVPGAALPNRRDYFKEFTADQFGHFQFKGIAPGQYNLYAWEDVESGAWFDPGFLQTFGEKACPVTIEAKGHQTAKLKAIPAAN